MSVRIHQVDSDGNLEWVERIIDNQWAARRLRGEMVTLHRDELRKLLRQAYRNGAHEQHEIATGAIYESGKLVPSEK
jgi:hypothetical protein